MKWKSRFELEQQVNLLEERLKRIEKKLGIEYMDLGSLSARDLENLAPSSDAEWAARVEGELMRRRAAPKPRLGPYY